LDLNAVPELTDMVTNYLYEIETKGMKSAIEAVLEVKVEQ
jgi:hypothetical protein